MLYLKGYLQYVQTGTIGRGNIFYDYLMNYYVPRNHDPGLSPILADPLISVERVARRFRDLDLFRKIAADGQSRAEIVAPIKLVVGDTATQKRLQIFEVGSDTPLEIKLVDGWHRLFAANLFGIEKLRFDVVREV